MLSVLIYLVLASVVLGWVLRAIAVGARDDE